MHNEPLSVRVHSCSRLIAIVVLTCCAATPGLQAAARAVTTAPIQSPAVQQPYPVQPAGVAAPAVIQPANPSISSPPIKASGTPGAGAAIPKLMEPDENDTDAERIRKLEATALNTPRKGSPAERNAARTAWLLGLLYLHGEHAPLDPVKAKKWFERAKALNEPLANAGLAWCEIDGCGAPPSPRSARPYLAALKPANPGLAAFLDWKVLERLAPVAGSTQAGAIHNDPDAQRSQLLQQAAQAGNASAINELGLLNVTASRYEQALAQFDAAAKRSPAATSNANLLRVRMQQHQKPGERNGGRNPEEWYEQARRYHRGDGIPSNYTEAIRLYQMAAAAGNPAARRMLELIYSRPAPGGSVNIAWMRQLANMDVTAEGAILNFYTPPTPLLFVRDITPLYEFIPQEWRKDRTLGQR